MKKKDKFENIKGKILTDEEGKQHVVLVEEKKTYSMRNMLPGPFFFIRSDGSDGIIKGEDIIEDLDIKEYKRLRKTQSFILGYIVDANEEEFDINSYNSLNDNQLDKLFKIKGADLDYIKNWISHMTSDFAINRMKNFIIRNEHSAVLSSQCDLRLAELNDEYEKNMIAPVTKGPKGV